LFLSQLDDGDDDDDDLSVQNYRQKANEIVDEALHKYAIFFPLITANFYIHRSQAD